MKGSAGDVLVVPRAAIAADRWFTRIGAADLARLESQAFWAPRPDAEKSRVIVQLVPIAVFRGGLDEYMLLQRSGVASTSLRSRLSLVVGGHVEPVGDAESSFEALLLATLTRELEEELGLDVHPSSLERLGLVVDARSVGASRHVGLLYRCDLDEMASPRVAAPEEFQSDSVFTTAFVPRKHLERLLPSLDPWSQIVVRDALD